MTKRRRARRALTGVTVLATALALPGSGSANAGPKPRFERLPDAAVRGNFVPAALDPTRKIKVLVEVAGDPVGEHVGDAADQGRTLSSKAKAEIRDQLRSRQRQVEQRVLARRGKVLQRYTDVFNGFAAEIGVKDLAALRDARGVVQVAPVRTYRLENTAGIRYIGGDKVWQDLGRTGAGVKIGVIDTGIDYTHADFGGSGDPAGFENNDGTVIEPGTFPTPKIAGGYDLVGDEYDDSSTDPAKRVPHPDPDPLDCHGHGTHVAGTVGGFGVTADGKTYQGRYDSSTLGKQFRVGPGVAPKATLYAYRVFGCAGSASSEVIVASMERALKDGMDLVNMSLGSTFGQKSEPDAKAVGTLTRAGVLVVASAGNDGPSAYVHGSPASATSALAVAAMDASRPRLPGAKLALGTGETITASNSNDAKLPSGDPQVAVLRTSYPDGPVALGCTEQEFANHPGGVAGKLVVTIRGTCARVKRAVLGQKAGAAAVAMINTAPGYPQFEGPITEDPDTGEKVNVTIPFLGIQGAPATDKDKLVAADGTAASMTATTVVNPSYARLASFSSGGPRNDDSLLKPDVTAPGVSVVSAGIGTGAGPATISGTSMAAPMTAGTAALIIEGHPKWWPGLVKGAIMSTADTGERFLSYTARVGGSGVVNARKAVHATVVATTQFGRQSLAFGYNPVIAGAYSETLPLTLNNTGSKAVTYDLAAAFNGASLGATVSVRPTRVSVPAGGSSTVDVTLALSKEALAELPAAVNSNFGALRYIEGAVTATPKTNAAGVYPLRVAFLAVPDALSEITPGMKAPYQPADGKLTTTLPVRNTGIHGGTADVFAWSVTDPDDVPGVDSMDVREAGAQSLPGEVLGGKPDDRSLVFAVNNHGRAANPATNEIDVVIDTTGDAQPDYLVVGGDAGRLTTGLVDGRFASFVLKVVAGAEPTAELVNAYVAEAPMNGGTALLPALASDIGLSADKSRFTFTVSSFSLAPEGFQDQATPAVWDAFEPPVSTGQPTEVAPGASTQLDLWVDPAAAADTPVLGWLVVSHDDRGGPEEANSVPLGTLPSLPLP